MISVNDDLIAKCSVCGKVKVQETWMGAESVELPADTRYTHGYCPVCYREAKERLKVEYESGRCNP